jgi:hypothetical protein
MASHCYTYVPSKDPNRRHIEKCARQISGMSLDEAKNHLRGLNTQVSACFTTFQELISVPTYIEMMAKGAYWKNFAASSKKNASSIRAVSYLNLYRLAQGLRCINPRFFALIQRIESFPWTLKHNTKSTHIAKIKKERRLMSLTEIHRQGLGDKLTGGTDHEGMDDKMIHNEDFVFFRLSCGTAPADSRFGTECLVFKPDQLFRLGWVSMHDMLSPSSTDRHCKLAKFESLDKVGANKSPFAKVVRTVSPTPTGIIYGYPENRKTPRRELHRVEIVFFGPDICRGIAYSVVNELYQMGGVEMLEMAMKYIGPEHDAILFNLINNLFWIEAKIPRFFLFAPHELLASHSDVEYIKNTFV